MLLVKADSLIGVLFIAPFALWPHAVTHRGVYLANGVKAQVILMFTSLAYFGWFTFIYVNAFYIHIDTQSAIALLFVGIYASPVLAALWLTEFWMEKKMRGMTTTD